uniref:Uncharacterized protein n=1 Tax=uncultured prokaryote TaxID=198431 RepID=A0A0H5Q7T5_9ZZZZ|nr:hypothetical protein [uncultured prokaryote]
MWGKKKEKIRHRSIQFMRDTEREVTEQFKNSGFPVKISSVSITMCEKEKMEISVDIEEGLVFEKRGKKDYAEVQRVCRRVARNLGFPVPQIVMKFDTEKECEVGEIIFSVKHI